MITGLKTSVLLVVAGVLIAVLASVTFLAYEKVIMGGDVMTVIVLILGAVGITSAVHVTGAAIATNATPPVVVAANPTTAPAEGAH